MAPAHTDALALAKRVEGKPYVLANYRAVRNAYRTGVRRQIAIEKFPERTFADEARMPVESFFLAFGSLRSSAMRRTSVFADVSYGEEHRGRPVPE